MSISWIDKGRPVPHLAAAVGNSANLGRSVFWNSDIERNEVKMTNKKRLDMDGSIVSKRKAESIKQVVRQGTYCKRVRKNDVQRQKPNRGQKQGGG